MNYKSRTTQITVLPDGEPMFSEKSTVISIEDEGGGEFLSISQSAGENNIRIDPEEWPHIAKSAERLISTMRPA